MTAYRFCRTDDIPLLVEAYRRAYAPHVPDQPALDAARFKGWIRDLDLWCSSCMVASDGADPVGVLLGAKRPAETLLIAVGVHPGHLRRGHGRHLLESLGSKLAILGPPRISVEVPAGDPRANAFFEACGYACESSMADFHRPAGGSGGVPEDAFTPVTLEELIQSGTLDPAAPRCWTRQVEALRRRPQGLEGLALASPDRVEAWALFRDGVAGREVLGLGTADADGPALGLLVAQLASRALHLGRVREDEIAWSALEAAGFQRGDLWRVRVAQPRAA